MQIVKGIGSYLEKDNDNSKKNIMSDVRYICKSCALVTESLQKRCDVMQMPNGDIIVIETKTSTFQYSWDDEKGKLFRVQAGKRSKKTQADRKPRSRKVAGEDSVNKENKKFKEQVLEETN